MLKWALVFAIIAAVAGLLDLASWPAPEPASAGAQSTGAVTAMELPVAPR